jgi:hypothetical protein
MQVYEILIIMKIFTVLKRKKSREKNLENRNEENGRRVAD